MTQERRRAMAELGRFLEGIPVVMATSVGADDLLRSRPMLLERLDDAGRLLFLTHLSSHKVREIDRDARVSVAFVGSNPERYGSISGRGTVTRERGSQGGQGSQSGQGGSNR
jgi:general stress protein 26